MYLCVKGVKLNWHDRLDQTINKNFILASQALELYPITGLGSSQNTRAWQLNACAVERAGHCSVVVKGGGCGCRCCAS